MRPLRQPVLLALCCCSASVIAFGPTVLGSRVTQQAGVGPDRVPAVAVEPEVPATVRVESRRLVPENEMHAFLGRYEAASSHAPTFNYGSSMADLRPRAGSGVREFVLNESVGVGMDRGIVVDGPSREENPRFARERHA